MTTVLPVHTHATATPELAVVLPVFNEQDAIAGVVHEWVTELDRLPVPFVILAIDDGSTDRTLEVLRRLERQYAPRMTVSTRANRGHGQTCLEGYRRAWSLGARYILQVDADGQCDPRFFRQFWDLRDRHAVVAGERTRRDDGVMRVVISQALGLFLRIRFGAPCPDANVPYRLMRAAAVIETVDRIPPSVDLANVALAVLLASEPSCAHAFVPIRFRERRGGRSSVSLPGFAAKAIRLHRDLRRLLHEPRRHADRDDRVVRSAKDSARCH